VGERVHGRGSNLVGGLDLRALCGAILHRAFVERGALNREALLKLVGSALELGALPFELGAGLSSLPVHVAAVIGCPVRPIVAGAAGNEAQRDQDRHHGGSLHGASSRCNRRAMAVGRARVKATFLPCARVRPLPRQIRSAQAFIVTLFAALALAVGLTAWVQDGPTDASRTPLEHSAESLRDAEHAPSSWRQAGSDAEPAIEPGGAAAHVVAARVPAARGGSLSAKRLVANGSSGTRLPSKHERTGLVATRERVRPTAGASPVLSAATIDWPSPRGPPASLV